MPDVASTPEAPPARACRECGAQLDERQQICVECGAAITEPRTRAVRVTRALKPLSLTAFAVLIVASAAYGLTASAGRDSDNLGAVAVAPKPPAPPAPAPTTQAPAPPTPAPTTPTPAPKPTPAKPPAATANKPPTAPAPTPPSPAPTTPAPASTPRAQSPTPSKPPMHRHHHAPGNDTHAAGDQPYSATLYDPYSDGTSDEHAKQAHRAVDGNEKTAWTTADHPDGLGKAGVGLVVEASGYQAYSALELQTKTPGYSVEVYSTDESDPPAGGPDQPGWQLEGRTAKVKEQQRIRLKGANSDPQYLLVWITKLPARSTRAGISEISLLP